jgi:hypothetical protein
LKQPNQPGMHLAIRGVNTSLKVDDPEFINELKKFNIIEPIRIVKRSENKILPIVKAKADNLQAFNHALQNGVVIGMTVFRCEKWDYGIKPLQCHNCNSFNHVAKFCKNDICCLICKGKHSFKVCPNKNDKTKLICANCDGNHAACSKSCPKMIERTDANVQKLTQNGISTRSTRSWAKIASINPGSTQETTKIEKNDELNKTLSSVMNILLNLTRILSIKSSFDNADTNDDMKGKENDNTDYQSQLSEINDQLFTLMQKMYPNSNNNNA